MKEVTITEDQLKNMLDKIKKLEEAKQLIKLLKEEVGFAERGYTQKAKREWVGLTDDDIAELRRNGAHSVSDKDFMAIEAKLKEKNT